MIIRSFDDSDVAGKVMKTATFTASGTWTKPDGVEYVLVDMCGGGGAGCGGTSSSSTCCGGRAGSYHNDKMLSVPDQTYDITVGLGGAAVTGSTGGSGGVSSFGSLLSASGGSGGATYSGPFGQPVVTSSGQQPLLCGGDGVDCPNFGVGGAGGKSGQSASSCPGSAAFGYGAGGGGAGVLSSVTNTTGGAGAPGIVIVKWFE